MSNLHALHALIPNFHMSPTWRSCDPCVSMRALAQKTVSETPVIRREDDCEMKELSA